MAPKREDAHSAEPATSADPVAYIYRGGGDSMPGIPARDLTVADLANLKAEDVEASGLYEKAVTS